ncbi:MAG: hypothetical protein KME19_16380 [Microcoleus vaginatus WJT46-NPBG5]|nr:hypothetical protein [Microcoleus vaginatus WJT46-NPBG5]
MPEVKQTLEQLVLRCLWQLLQNGDPATSEAEFQRIERMIELGRRMNLGLEIDRAQELYFNWLQTEQITDLGQLRRLLQLGQMLVVDVSTQLSRLS